MVDPDPRTIIQTTSVLPSKMKSPVLANGTLFSSKNFRRRVPGCISVMIFQKLKNYVSDFVFGKMILDFAAFFVDQGSRIKDRMVI